MVGMPIASRLSMLQLVHRHAWLCMAAAYLTTLGCTIDRQLHASPGLDGVKQADSPFLKAHFKNGDVVVLYGWTIDATTGVVHGRGERRNMNRAQVAHGALSFPVSEVALFETNRETVNAGPIAALTVVTLASVAVTVACATNPKACFGSCPTFYVSDGATDYLAAEGFSESVAPALEATDVDALWRAKISGRTAHLRVTNEALETHTIKQANLLVAPRPVGGRVVRTVDGHFVEAREFRAPSSCHADEGDCLPAVKASDDVERISTTDGHDLATREFVEVTFDGAAPSGTRHGLVIEARQGFITTYLFYQALAYMGRKAGTYLAAMEQGDASIRGHAHDLYHLLGGIDVQIRDARGAWRTIGTYMETGPLAREVQVVPLPEGASAQSIRLVMARGHFRLGQLALVDLGRDVDPVRVPIARITTTAGNAWIAQEWLAGRSPALVTMPGDEHALEYDLPADGEGLEFFLEARGFYLEWMRQEWLREESDWKLGRLFFSPASALRELAPAYKKIEPRIEAMFWESRYVR
jgi:hypothetical protein